MGLGEGIFTCVTLPSCWSLVPGDTVGGGVKKHVDGTTDQETIRRTH